MLIAVNTASSFSYFVRRPVESDIKRKQEAYYHRYYTIILVLYVKSQRIDELLRLNKHCYNNDILAYDFSNGMCVGIPTDLFKFI